ncbi:hypothetical protein ABG067_007217 [Albugo candida]
MPPTRWAPPRGPKTVAGHERTGSLQSDDLEVKAGGPPDGTSGANRQARGVTRGQGPVTGEGVQRDWLGDRPGTACESRVLSMRHRRGLGRQTCFQEHTSG